jgi:hypothetical protein
MKIFSPGKFLTDLVVSHFFQNHSNRRLVIGFGKFHEEKLVFCGFIVVTPILVVARCSVDLAETPGIFFLMRTVWKYVSICMMVVFRE